MVNRIFSDADIIEAIVAHHGRITRAAQAIGCSAKTIHERRHESPEVDEAVRYAREELLDLAEEGLEKLIKEGDFRAISFTLRTLGKDRGYAERPALGLITDEMLDRAIAEERAKLGESDRLPPPEEDGNGELAHAAPAS